MDLSTQIMMMAGYMSILPMYNLGANKLALCILVLGLLCNFCTATQKYC